MVNNLKYYKKFENVTIQGTGTIKLSENGEISRLIEFSKEDGEIINLDQKTLIPNVMLSTFKVGVSGDFYFGFTNDGYWVLLASKIGDQRRTYKNFRIRTLLMSAGCPSLILAILFFYIVIPFYSFLRVRRNKDAKTIISHLEEKGFVFSQS